MSGRRLHLGLAAAALLLALLAALVGDPRPDSRRATGSERIASTGLAVVDASTLADWIMERRDDFLVLDLRQEDAFQRYHIPFARRVATDSLRSFDPAEGRRLVLCARNDSLPPDLSSLLPALPPSRFGWLGGGIEAWASDILFPDLGPSSGLDSLAARRASERSRYFGGSPRSGGAPVEKPSPDYVREGC